MVFDNLQVKHKAFGVGTVVATDGKYMTVRFDNGEKKFVYPDSFEKYLTLADGTVSDEILSDLAAINLIKQQIIDKKNAENAHARAHGIVIPGKEITNESEDEDGNFKNSDSEEI